MGKKWQKRQKETDVIVNARNRSRITEFGDELGFWGTNRKISE